MPMHFIVCSCFFRLLFLIPNKIGFLPSHANNSISSDHNTFTNELNNMSNATIPSLVGNMNADGGHSPNHNSMISSQILGSTPLSQIGCPLPIDPYASKWNLRFTLFSLVVYASVWFGSFFSMHSFNALFIFNLINVQTVPFWCLLSFSRPIVTVQ